LSDNPIDVLKKILQIQGIVLDERRLAAARAALEGEELPTSKRVRYVEWVEPLHYRNPEKPEEYAHTSVPRISRVTTQDAITLQKTFVAGENERTGRKFEYENDYRALDDFIVTHWATIVEVEE
jgi:hypothetical protein